MDPKTLSFAIFWPSEAKNTKKNFQNQSFLCFMKRGPSWPLEATKCKKKTYSGDPKILSFSVFWPPEAKNNLFCIKYKKKNILKIFVCTLCEKVIFGLWRSENGKRKDFWVPRIRFSGFVASKGQK